MEAFTINSSITRRKYFTLFLKRRFKKNKVVAYFCILALGTYLAIYDLIGKFEVRLLILIFEFILYVSYFIYKANKLYTIFQIERSMTYSFESDKFIAKILGAEPQEVYWKEILKVDEFNNYLVLISSAGELYIDCRQLSTAQKSFIISRSPGLLKSNSSSIF